jgi:oxygen-dependent protoporphyrinogen oxidase
MPGTVVVVGGGVAGLTVACRLQRRAGEFPGGLNVLCLEDSHRPGGNIRTSREDGYVCEWGPNGFLDNAPATLELARDLGIEDRLLPADAQSAIRYIFRDGKLHRVPDGPGSFLLSGILSPGGRLRVLGEPFARRRPAGIEETVHQFAERRIGPEPARVLVGAMVTGIYAGDARRLCLRSTFPKMFEMESEHGGLFRAMLAKRKEARKSGKRTSAGPAGPGGHLTSFPEGLQELTDALALSLGDALRLDCPVETISRGNDGGYLVHVADGEPLAADGVVLACPSWKSAGMVAELDPVLAGAMDAIPSAPVAVVHFGYDLKRLEDRPRGFGFLVPRDEGPRILGTLWSSNIFPNRSPSGKFLMTSMIGGSMDPGVVDLGNEVLTLIAREDLQRIMGVTAEPEFVRIHRHPRGIPQYVVGHQGRLETIDRRLADLPGLLVHGNSYRGISVNLCVEQAPGIVERLISHLSRT